MDEPTNSNAIDTLLQVMAKLRDPEFGCPWDLKQTPKSLIPYTLEEVYEVVDAIDSNDIVEIEEELGDLLFQVIFYAQIGHENNQFDINSIADSISAKLLRRHPHVFPDGKLENFGKKSSINAEQVEAKWEEIKAEERRLKQEKRTEISSEHGVSKSVEHSLEQSSVIDSVASSIPALQRANKIQSKVAREGFDWSSIKPVLHKLKEEIAEFEQALEANDAESMSDELGDVLFATVNVARHANIEPESALRHANDKFSTRYKWIEATLAKRNSQVSDCSEKELDMLWNEAKQSSEISE